jgi:transcriptional regulator with XRE-family HTH domain
MATLREWLSVKGVTQKQLADRIGSTQSAIAKYLAGQKPRDPYMDRIYRETGGEVTANDFYGHLCPEKRRRNRKQNSSRR